MQGDLSSRQRAWRSRRKIRGYGCCRSVFGDRQMGHHIGLLVGGDGGRLLGRLEEGGHCPGLLGRIAL